jgi:subtilisin family serine protease
MFFKRWLSSLLLLVALPAQLLAVPPQGKDRMAAVAAVPGQPPAPGDEKIDPLLRMTIDQVAERWSRMQPLAVELPPRNLPVVLEQDGLSEPLAQVFVRTDDVESTLRAIDEAGGHHSTVTPGIVVGAIPLSAVRPLAARPEIRFIEGSRWMKATLDASRPEIKADQVQAGTGLPQPYDGTGVIVGVVDTGIDWSHSDFKDGSGKSRIQYLWDMSRSGKAPTGFTQGWEYTKADIDGGSCQEIDGPGGDGHGTHTSGTAAGNGARSGGKYVGIAPKAGIVFVKADRVANSSGSFSNTDLVDSVNYIFQKGAALGMPVSINMSIGGQAGPHDGSTASEQMLRSLTGPGKILSVSAGNSGADPIHLGYSTQGSAYLSGASTDLLPYGTATDFAVILVAPSGVSVGLKSKTSSGTYCNGIGPVTPGNATSLTTMSCSGTTIGYAKIDGTTASGGLTLYYVTVSNNGSSSIDITKSGWELYTFGSGRIDAWFYSGGEFNTRSDPANGWLPGDTSMTVSAPATASGLIAVAAYVTKTQWTTIDGATQNPPSGCYSTPDIFLNQIACFSSLGPTRDGRQKPDIAAPGMFIAAPLSSALDVNNSAVRPNIVSGGYYRIDQGTSMAAPHIAGVVALMLQANPLLTPAQALQALQQTARHDSFTGSVPNMTWGGGKVDALAAVKAVAPATQPDFTISTSPTSLSVTAGGGASSQITTAVSGGFSSGISLSASGLPAGATASFSPATISSPGSGTSTMSISTSSSTPADTYDVTVTGSGGGKSHAATIFLAVRVSSVGPSSCVEDAATMCLTGGRYQIRSHWKNQYAGGAVSILSKAKLTDVTGAFWIANSSTYEYLIRFNTATDNGRVWIAIPTFTDVEFWIDVTDTRTGQSNEYHSPASNRTLLYDTNTFVYP